MIEELINHPVTVFLKENRKKISGILVDFDDDFLWLQSSELLIVPTINVLYCSLKSTPSKNVSEPVKNGNLRIFVDNILVANLELPPEVNLLNANQQLLNHVWGSNEVQEVLQDKVQKSLHYAPGEVYITTNSYNENQEHQPNDDFSLSPTTNFLQPIDMVHRLQGLGKKYMQKEESKQEE